MANAFSKRNLAAFLFVPSILFAQAVTVNFDSTDQKIDGFGASSAWEGAFSSSLMDAIFNNGANQLGLTILRCRIAYDADASNTATWADEKSNATFAKARGAMVFATPWSPPESLKVYNGDMVTGHPEEHGSINTAKFASFAAWMKAFWTYVGNTNIDIMSLENEPDYAAQANYEGCSWTAQNFLDFCKTYAPLIGKPIMMPESASFNWALSDPTLGDSTAAKNVSYIGGHMYGGQPKVYTKAISLGKHVWMTEWNATDYSAAGIMVLAKQILDCMYNDFNAYVYWWMTANGNGIISTAGVPNKYGWVLASFSKWVRPGFYRVSATYNPQSGVYVVAFKGAQNVIVAVNNATSSKSQTFTYSGATVTSVEKYTTSSSKNISDDGAITATSNSFTTSLDAQSVTTLVSAGTVSMILVPKAEGYSLVKPLGANPFGNVLYLLNGQRVILTAHRNPGADVFVVPGKTPIGIGTGNPPQDSNP